MPVEDTLIANASRWVDHPSGFFALSSRNEHFSLPGVGGFVSYREWGKHLAVFGGVHAAPADREVILDAFIAHAESRRRRIVVVQLCASQTELFARRGFAINQFGTSYGIDLRRFTLRGTAKMQLRNKISRARKLGLRIAEIGREYPRSEDTFARLRDISTRWLRGKGKELDFMIGEIGGPEDTVRRIFVIVDGRGDLIGFITYVPVWGLRPGYLHDLTRRLPTAPAGAMELCNAFAIERLAAEGVAHLHFGFTPFITTGAEPSSANRLVAWTIRQLRKYGGFVYPAESQAQYKLKWRPDLIEPEYLAARPMSVRAVIDLLTLTRSL
ncbi:MAG TPA: DUF2156 domain-containing protein [Candidatus Acidoferrales bacterium]|nr:DUF2156 domain-containing protein [Candidatus Acidoferrales bacterium]